MSVIDLDNENENSQEKIDSQFNDDDEVDQQQSEKEFLSACKEMILRVEDDKINDESEEEHTFSRDS